MERKAAAMRSHRALEAEMLSAEEIATKFMNIILRAQAFIMTI